MSLFITPPRRGSTFIRRSQLQPLDDDRQKLAIGATNLAFQRAHLARRQRAVELSELIGIALQSLVEAAGRYDATVGTPFPIYAAMIIGQRLRTANETERKAFRPNLFADDYEPPDYRTAPPDRKVLARTAVQALKKFLRPNEFEILWKKYADGRSHESLAQEMGITKAGVGSRLERAVRHARAVFPELVESEE